MEHVLVHLAVSTTQTAVEHPVVEAPCIDEANSVRPDVLQQLHHGVCPGQHDLVLAASAASVELAALLLKCVQGEEAEQLHQYLDSLVVDLRAVGNGLQRRQVVLDDHPLGVSLGQAVEVNEEVVPGLLLRVTVLGCLEGKERHAPCEGIDEVLVRSDDVEGTADLAARLELGEDLGCVVGGALALEDRASRLEQVAGYLLGEHVVVALPCKSGEVVGIPGADAAMGALACDTVWNVEPNVPEARVTVTTASATADLETLTSNGTAEGLEGARRCVQVSHQITARLQLLGASTTLCVALVPRLGHLRLVGVVHVHHRLSCEVEGECGGNEGEKTDLDHGVVENGCLSLASGGITVLELATNRTVASGDGDTTSKNASGLHHNTGADPGECAIDKRGRATAAELVGLGINILVLGQHADVWDLDVVEEEEAVVHGVIAELGANVTNVNIRQRLVCLHVTDLNAEWGRAVRLALDDELSHDHGVVCCAAEGADPPLAGSEMWGVQGEGLVLLVPGRCGLEASDVGAVTELSLSVASDDLVVVGLGEPHLLLFLCTLAGKGDLKG